MSTLMLQPRPRPHPRQRKRRSQSPQRRPSTCLPTRRPRLLLQQFSFAPKHSRCRLTPHRTTHHDRQTSLPLDRHWSNVQRPQRGSGAQERHNVLERELSWLTKPTARNPPSSTHPHPAPATRDIPVRAPALHVLHVPQAVLALAALADASSSGARRSASSAPRRSTPSRTATFACCRASLRSVARSFRVV